MHLTFKKPSQLGALQIALHAAASAAAARFNSAAQPLQPTDDVSVVQALSVG